jgi:hypothetical protein
MMNRTSTGVLHSIGSDGLENEGDGFKKRRSRALHGARDRVCLAVYEMPNPTIAAGTVVAVHEERGRKSSSFFLIGIDLTGRPLQLHGLGELLPATLTDRFVGAFVVVPASRFRRIVSAAEGTF